MSTIVFRLQREESLALARRALKRSHKSRNLEARDILVRALSGEAQSQSLQEFEAALNQLTDLLAERFQSLEENDQRLEHKVDGLLTEFRDALRRAKA